MYNILRKSRLYLFSVIFSGVALHVTTPATSQPTPKDLTLHDAISMSLKNNHQLHAGAARIRQAQASVDEARESRLPDASISASYLRLGNPNIDINMGKPAKRPDTASTALPSVHQAMYGIANVALPVFAGGKIRYGVESAKFLRQAAMLDAKSDSQAVILNTIEAYANLYKAGVTVEVFRENLAQSKYRDSVLMRLEQNGLLARNDRLKAALQTSNIALSLLDAESNRKLAMINMDLMMGLPENTILQADSAGFQLPESLPTLAIMQQQLDRKRSDLQAMAEREHAAQSNIDMVRANYFPSLAITGGYIAAYVPRVLTITNAINVGVALKYNLSALWKTKSKIREATAKLNELQANEAAMTDAILLELNRNFEHYMLQRRKITVYESAVTQASENYRISKNKFDNQLLNTTDLLDANLLLLQSRINLAVAKADLYVAYAKLLQTGGTL